MQTWTGYGETRKRSEQTTRIETCDDGFEAVTISAAARVLELRSAGVIDEVERRFYLSELAAMDEIAGPSGDAARLERLARRHLGGIVDRAIHAAEFALAA